MVIDIHTHIFPKAICEQRERYFTDEPDFRLLYASSKSTMVNADQLIASMDEHKVDKAVTFGFPWRRADTFKRHNDYVMEAVNRYPDRLIGFCCLDTMHPQAAAEVERCLLAGFSGVGELAFYCSDLDDKCVDSLEPIMALCRQFDCPVMVHTNEPVGHNYPGKTPNTLAQIYALAKQYAQNRLILAHWGGGIFWYMLLKKEVTPTLANVWFDTAASPYLYRPEIYRLAVQLAGTDKLLFGTDYPLIAPTRYYQEIQKAGLSEAEKQNLYYRNAADLLKLSISTG